MKKILFLIAIVLLSILIFSNMRKPKGLEIGDTVPSFRLKDQNGRLFNSDSLIGKRPFVIYFYPKDDTPGCTKEACGFRDDFEVFTELGATVIGVSADDVASHKAFAEKYNLPFTLLSDPENRLKKQFGFSNDLFGLLPGRVTYIVNKNGIIVHRFKSQLNVKKHIDEAKRILKNLNDE